MNRRIFLLGVIIFILGLYQPASAETRLDFAPFYQQADLIWNKAGPGGSPNVLSELKWERLRIKGIKGEYHHDISRRYFFEAAAGYGWIFAGSNQDSDYDFDDRKGEFSRSYANAGAGNAVEASLSFGLNLPSDPGRQTSLLAGYALSRQTVTMRDGNLVIPAIGHFDVNTAYVAIWQGPWLGLVHSRQLNARTHLSARLEYHWMDYDGRCYWNLRTDLEQPVTNNHWARAQGAVASLGIDYVTGPRWTLGARIGYTRFKTSPGTDQVNSSDGTKTRIPLNEVVWKAWTNSINATYRF